MSTILKHKFPFFSDVINGLLSTYVIGTSTWFDRTQFTKK